MTLIDAVTNQPNQQINLILPDTTIVPFILQYMDGNQGWFFSMPSLNINNMALVVSPNCLRDFRRVIDFGLALDTNDGYESVFINDFTNGRASLYLLDAEDVADVEAIIQNVS